MPIFTRAKKRSEQAFSLIEWMVVLMIIGMTLAIVIPKVGGIPSGVRVSSSRDAIRNAFKTASSTALATGQTVQAYFDFSAHEIRLTRIGATRGSDAGLDEPEWSIYDEFSVFKLDDSVFLNDQRMEYPADPETVLSYRFFPDGEATGPAMPILIANRWFMVDVDRLTGRPLLEEEDEN